MHAINIPYKDKGIELEGFVATPSEEKRPVVILCHAWKGRDDFICEKAKAIAEWDYVVSNMICQLKEILLLAMMFGLDTIL